MFLECKQLAPLFILLEYNFFFKSGELKCGFIFGAVYAKKQATKWKQLRFLIGQATFSINNRRINKINNVTEPKS